jgi:hypothetical protein
VVIHKFGAPDEKWDEIDGEIKECQWISKKIKIEDLDKKKKFEKVETPLVAHVKCDKYDLESCSIIMVVLKEEFVFSM